MRATARITAIDFDRIVVYFLCNISIIYNEERKAHYVHGYETRKADHVHFQITDVIKWEDMS